MKKEIIIDILDKMSLTLKVVTHYKKRKIWLVVDIYQVSLPKEIASTYIECKKLKGGEIVFHCEYFNCRRFTIISKCLRTLIMTFLNRTLYQKDILQHKIFNSRSLRGVKNYEDIYLRWF